MNQKAHKFGKVKKREKLNFIPILYSTPEEKTKKHASTQRRKKEAKLANTKGREEKRVIKERSTESCDSHQVLINRNKTLTSGTIQKAYRLFALQMLKTT